MISYDNMTSQAKEEDQRVSLGRRSNTGGRGEEDVSVCCHRSAQRDKMSANNCNCRDRNS